jgi:hypothetical protein
MLLSHFFAFGGPSSNIRIANIRIGTKIFRGAVLVATFGGEELLPFTLTTRFSGCRMKKKEITIPAMARKAPG